MDNISKGGAKSQLPKHEHAQQAKSTLFSAIGSLEQLVSELRTGERNQITSDEPNRADDPILSIEGFLNSISDDLRHAEDRITANINILREILF